MKLHAPWLENNEIKIATKAFADAGVELRFVGGCVRDTLLGKAFSDIDAATPISPNDVMALLESAGIVAIPTGIAYGTVTALINQKPIQITTLRKDIATDGRHAEVAYTNNWQEDATRRDFTMNALYLSPEGELFDYVGGIADAEKGMVRFIGNADARIKEDYLRILRFFRFSAHYAKGDYDKNGLQACAANVAGIGHLSGERIQYEMMKLLSAKNAASVLSLMHDSSVLSRVLIDFREIDKLKKLEDCSCFEKTLASPLLKLSTILPDQSSLATLARRWKLSNSDKQNITLWHSYAGAITPAMSLAEQKKALRLWGKEHYLSALLLSYAASDQPWKHYAPLLTMIKWEAPLFPLNGDDLKAYGVKPGKLMGATLKRLEEVWEESDYALSREDLLRLV